MSQRQRSLRPGGGAGVKLTGAGRYKYPRRQLLELRRGAGRCPGDLERWLRDAGLEVKPRYFEFSEPQEANQRAERGERRERKGASDGRDDWRHGSDHHQQQHAGGAGERGAGDRPRKGKKERDKTDLWDTPDDTAFDFSAASLLMPRASDLLQQAAKEQQAAPPARASKFDSREEAKDGGEDDGAVAERRRSVERANGQWKSSGPAPAVKPKPKPAAAAAAAAAGAAPTVTRKIDERFKHLLTAQSTATLDDLIDDDVGGGPDGDDLQPEQVPAAPQPAYHARSASTDSEKRPRAIDMLMQDQSPTFPTAAPQPATANLKSLESFVDDALRTLINQRAIPMTPPREQRRDDQERQTGSRFLSWMQQTAGEPESTPERPVSGFDESSLVLSIEDLLGEQFAPVPAVQPQPQPQPQPRPAMATPMPVQSLFATMAATNAPVAPVAPVAAPVYQDLHAVLPRGATVAVAPQEPPVTMAPPVVPVGPGVVSMAPMAPHAMAPHVAPMAPHVAPHVVPAAVPPPAAVPASPGPVNLLEKLKFVEPAPETPTKAPAAQPTSTFSFHQQTTAPRSSSKKPKRLVSAASRIVRTEQQTTPGRASPVDANASSPPPPPPSVQPSTQSTPEAAAATRKPVQPATAAPAVAPLPAPAAAPTQSAPAFVPPAGSQRISVDQLLGMNAQRSQPQGNKA